MKWLTEVSSERMRFEGFFDQLTTELMKLPEPARLQMQNEIMKLFRPNPNNEAERQSTINLINQLNSNISYQYNLLNTQIDFLSQIKQHIEQGAPQPPPCTCMPPQQPRPGMIFVQPVQMAQPAMRPCMGCYGGYMDMQPQMFQPHNCQQQHGPPMMAPNVNMPNQFNPQNNVNQLNNEQPNAGGSRESEEEDEDYEMGTGDDDRDTETPEFPEAVQNFIEEVSPMERRRAVIAVLRRYFGRPRRNTGNQFNNPYLRRNAFGTVVHMCDDLVLTYANDILYRVRTNASPTRVQDIDPNFSGASAFGLPCNKSFNILD
ncbi:hypothetical protein O3G_MSEX000096 [Manduca sexta]|nr:hypothetical protein O3G_MSEX000096 [Manduca sexta]